MSIDIIRSLFSIYIYIYTLFTSFSIISIILLLSGLFICFKEIFPSKNTYQVTLEKKIIKNNKLDSYLF